MSALNSLLEQISLYVDDKISLQDLESWIVPNLPFLLEEPLSKNADAAAAVELCLAEWADGIRTEDEAKAFLRQVLQENNTIFARYDQECPIVVETTACSQTAYGGLSISSNVFMAEEAKVSW